MSNNIGVYITLLNDELLIPHSFAAVYKFFPQVKVIDVGSEDSSCDKVPKKHLIREGIKDPKGYIEMKNSYSDKHDQVFWLDSDEIYPESALRRIQFLLETDRERIPSYWRSVKVTNDGQVYIEEPALRGFSAWRSKTNRLYRNWPGEHLLNVDPKYRDKKQWLDPKIWCWHGVLLNRSNMREATNRFKKRLDRMGEANKRNTWSRYGWIPWSDEDPKIYIPKRTK